jgi:hypothetical protein
MNMKSCLLFTDEEQLGGNIAKTCIVNVGQGVDGVERQTIWTWFWILR